MLVKSPKKSLDKSQDKIVEDIVALSGKVAPLTLIKAYARMTSSMKD